MGNKITHVKISDTRIIRHKRLYTQVFKDLKRKNWKYKLGESFKMTNLKKKLQLSIL